MAIISGHPNLINLHSYKKFVVTITLFVHNALVSIHFFAWFVATNMYLFPIYLLVGIIGPTKSNPHFINGSFGRVVTNLAKPYVANPLMH